MRRLRLTPEAELDVDEAHHPEAYQLVDRKMRRALLRRFPYAVFFEVERTEIVVYAVFHCARDPRSWKRRRDA